VRKEVKKKARRTAGFLFPSYLTLGIILPSVNRDEPSFPVSMIKVYNFLEIVVTSVLKES